VRLQIDLRLAYGVATLLNSLDLSTSYVIFRAGGFELGAWARLIHNNYLACLAAVLLYQAAATLLYYLAVRFRPLSPLFTTWSLIKVYAVAWNLAQIL
jgi:hypothetical protein